MLQKSDPKDVYLLTKTIESWLQTQDLSDISKGIDKTEHLSFKKVEIAT